jgi:hypothetical protein
MAQTFIIYLKEGGTLTLEFSRFQVDGNSFIVYDRFDQAANESFISFDNVAAIVPLKQSQRDWRFKVHLKTGSSFEVSADLFKTTDGRLQFYRHNHPREDLVLENLYVALSEVVLIMPASFLMGE